MPSQFNCHGMCKTTIWLSDWIENYSQTYFHMILFWAYNQIILLTEHRAMTGVTCPIITYDFYSSNIIYSGIILDMGSTSARRQYIANLSHLRITHPILFGFRFWQWMSYLACSLFDAFLHEIDFRSRGYLLNIFWSLWTDLFEKYIDIVIGFELGVLYSQINWTTKY